MARCVLILLAPTTRMSRYGERYTSHFSAYTSAPPEE
jgi:hypothetical protein